MHIYVWCRHVAYMHIYMVQACRIHAYIYTYAHACTRLNARRLTCAQFLQSFSACPANRPGYTHPQTGFAGRAGGLQHSLLAATGPVWPQIPHTHQPVLSGSSLILAAGSDTPQALSPLALGRQTLPSKQPAMRQMELCVLLCYLGQPMLR